MEQGICFSSQRKTIVPFLDSEERAAVVTVHLAAFDQESEQILQGKAGIGFPLNNQLLPLAADPTRCRDHHVPVGHTITALSKRLTIFFFYLSHIAKDIYLTFFQTIQSFNTQARQNIGIIMTAYGYGT